VRNTPSGQIVAMVVGEKYRRRGIGQALLAQADVWFAARGVQRVSLTSALHRSDAHAFYRACGYEENGLRFVREL
jgi:GNAT superfamily N-acetyltransferase